MPDLTPLSIVLEFARGEKPEEPHAFRFEPQDYMRRTEGGSIKRFRIEWNEALIADIEAIRRPGRDPAVVQRVGDLLRNALELAGWDDVGQRIHAASEEDRPVFVTLRSNAAELYALPWELLTIGASGQHLGEIPGVLLRHEWPATSTAPEEPAPRDEGGRILFAWSAGGGEVPAGDHLQAIALACEDGYVSFDKERDVLPHATAAGIADALAEAEAQGRPFAVLHLLCHGGLAGSTSGMALNGSDGSPSIVDSGRLRQLLAPHAKTLRLVVIAACDGGFVGDPGNHLGSVAQALHRAGLQSVIASRYPLSITGSTVLATTLYRSLLVDLRSLEHAFMETRRQQVREEQHLDWASMQLYAREADGDDTRPIVFRPYRGLLRFEEVQARFFMGRETEREETLGDLQALIDAGQPRFVVVIGASGTGMSSLVLAGVVPELDRLRSPGGGPWEVALFRPGNHPREALEAALAARDDESRPFLLIVDQFEELFTHTENPALREDITRRLWSLTSGDTGIHCIITIRVDFLGDCGDIVLDDTGVRLDRITCDPSHRVFVARMGPEAVRRAIEAPAALVGLDLEPGLTERLIEDVGNEPGALPLLQYALDRLWLRRVGRTLSARVYSEFGGIAGALQSKADSLIDALSEVERRMARALLIRLVGISEDEFVDTRRRVEMAFLEPTDEKTGAIFRRVLALLVDARLLVRGEERGSPTLEIAHESLIRKWPRLRSWLREDRGKMLELQQVTEWAHQLRALNTLLSGSQLERSSSLVRLYPEEMEGDVVAFVNESQARERRRRMTLLGILSVAVLATCLALAALTFWWRAESREREVRDNLRVVEDAKDRSAKEAAERWETVRKCLQSWPQTEVTLRLCLDGLRPPGPPEGP